MDNANLVAWTYLSFLCQNIMRKLVDAAIEMHSRGVFHWDIKANNIVIEVSADSWSFNMPTSEIHWFWLWSHFYSRSSHSKKKWQVISPSVQMSWTLHASCVHVNSSPLIIFLWISETTLDLYESNVNTADCITVLQLGTVMDKLLHYILPDTSTKSRSRTRSDISDGKPDVNSPTCCDLRYKWKCFFLCFLCFCLYWSRTCKSIGTQKCDPSILFLWRLQGLSVRFSEPDP